MHSTSPPKSACQSPRSHWDAPAPRRPRTRVIDRDLQKSCCEPSTLGEQARPAPGRACSPPCTTDRNSLRGKQLQCPEDQALVLIRGVSANDEKVRLGQSTPPPKCHHLVRRARPEFGIGGVVRHGDLVRRNLRERSQQIALAGMRNRHNRVWRGECPHASSATADRKDPTPPPLESCRAAQTRWAC